MARHQKPVAGPPPAHVFLPVPVGPAPAGVALVDEPLPRLHPLTGSALSEAAIDFALGLPSAVSVPVVRPDTDDEPPPYGPYLFPDVTRRGRVWTIRDRPTALELQLGTAKPFRRIQTRFKIHDLDGAKLFFLNWLHQRRNEAMGLVLPTQIEFTAVLRHYIRHLQNAIALGHIKPKTRKFRLNNLKPLTEYWSGLKLGDLTGPRCAAYVMWRTAQRIKNQNEDATNPRFVSRNTTRHELKTLANALNVYCDDHGVMLSRKVKVPQLEKKGTVWLSRGEVARLLWSCRGRVWNPAQRRWRTRADDEPSLAGTEEGKLHAIDRRYAKGSGKAMARLIRLGVYSGSRLLVLLGANFENDETLAHFDATGEVFHRRGTEIDETMKRTPEILMPGKLALWVGNWGRIAARTGIARVVHKPDGTPYAGVGTYAWTRLCEAAGLGKRVTTHALRHTSAMWLKLEGVSIDQAGDYLGMTPETLRRHYGRWDLLATAAPATALGACKGLKAAVAEARARGLR